MSSPVTAGWGYVAGGYGAIGTLVGGYVVSVVRRRRSLTRRLHSEVAGLGTSGSPTSGGPAGVAEARPGIPPVTAGRDREAATAATEEGS